MSAFFRKLPLSIKLLMIGIIPIVFLIYFSVIIYNEKSQTVKLIGNYIEGFNQSVTLGELIDQLARERRFSYQYVVKKKDLDKMIEHRQRTDSIISILENDSNISLTDFTKYPFPENLHKIRSEIDTISGSSSSGDIVEFYTETILRLNSLNSVIPSNTFLMPVYQDLVAQRTLSEMITYLGIIRTNVFNSLYTKVSTPQTLLNTLAMYKTFNSYETEFLLKASPLSVRSYNNKKKITEYGAVIDYLDNLFAKLKFDSTYSAEQWWDICTEGMRTLRRQQRDLFQTVSIKIEHTYQHEKNIKNATIVFLLISTLFVIVFVAYTINDITKLLRELKVAARKISKGATGIDLKDMPRGVVGSLAKSIAQIDKNNLLMAQAANQIGKGNFDVTINPRSDEDVLGISIKKMKRDLREFNAQKDKIQKETEELIYKRDEFFSIASHELKTPVTSLKAYTQLLLMDAKVTNDEQNIKMLSKMDFQIVKLTSLINDLLDTSRLQSGTLSYHKEPFQLKKLIPDAIEKIKSTAPDFEFVFKSDTDAYVNADRERIGQVITNFLSNAIKYGGSSKKINIELNKKDNKIVCSVEDFGKGIVPEEQDKVFGRFYRISGKNMNTFPGLGLGLFISKEIIEHHGGKIGVTSERDKGSVFYFELPVSEEVSQKE
jgi:signal transduction histidine kinase